MNEIITANYFPGQDCDCEARSSYECGCDADWTPVEVYKLREDAKQLADRLTALELHSTSELARLERERNEAREAAERWESSSDAMERAGAEQARRADENREWALKAERERDEALEKVEQQRKEIVRLNGATNHAGGTPLKIALKERDEAREDLDEETKFHHRTHIELIQTQCKLLDVEMQRDEARDAIVGWENKWKCAVDMAARAELERDEALKCAKEYYVEFIRNASSDNKVSKPNPLKPFYKY